MNAREKFLKNTAIVKAMIDNISDEEASALADILDVANDMIEGATRPAAPVEGLEGAAWQRKHPTAGWMDCREEDIPHYEKRGQEVRELSPRSQAEAIIAVKDDEITNQDEMLQFLRDALSTAEADNAALTARVKVLGTVNAKLCDDVVDYELKIAERDVSLKALETQLAAAKKALERADEALQLGATEPGHTYVKIALGEVQS